MSTYWHVDDEIWDDGAPDAVPIPAATAVELLNDMERSLGEATDRENRLKERVQDITEELELRKRQHSELDTTCYHMAHTLYVLRHAAEENRRNGMGKPLECWCDSEHGSVGYMPEHHTDYCLLMRDAVAEARLYPAVRDADDEALAARAAEGGE